MLTKQTYTMKCRVTGYTAKVHVIEVGDVPGHIIGVGEFPGVWSCDDGSVATSSTKGHVRLHQRGRPDPWI